MRILVAEDERHLAQALKKILETAGYGTDVVYDGITALDYALVGNYDLLLLDVMMPEMDGVSVVKELRAQQISTPILMLTARTSTADKVLGLNSGADDYMTKPFETEELLARAWALTRRSGTVVMDDLTFGDLRLNIRSGLLYCGDASVQLSHRELDIARIFFSDPQETVSKESFLNRVWGMSSDAGENNVEAYISFLRKKFRYLHSQVSIVNIQRIGYRMEVAPC